MLPSPREVDRMVERGRAELGDPDADQWDALVVAQASEAGHSHAARTFEGRDGQTTAKFSSASRVDLDQQIEEYLAWIRDRGQRVFGLVTRSFAKGEAGWRPASEVRHRNAPRRTR